MSAGGGQVQLIDLFRGLGQDMWAEGAYPLDDGSVLFIYPSGTGHSRLLWRVDLFHGALTHDGIGGCFISQGLAQQQVQNLLRRLGEVQHGWSQQGIDPFAIGPRSSAPLTLSPSLESTVLAPFFEPEVSSWGDFLLKEVQGVAKDALSLVFEGGEGRVAFEIVPSASAQDRVWKVVPPVALRIVEDSRRSSARGTYGAAVERYVAYALRRALDPTAQITVEGRRARRREAPPADPALETVEAAIADPFDETPADAFFVVPGIQVMDCQQELSTLLDADDGVVPVSHLGRECTTHYPWVNSSFQSPHLYPRCAHLPVAVPAKPAHFVEASELDLALGDESELGLLLREAASRRGVRAVVLLKTCYPEAFGLDMEGILADEAEPSDALGIVLELSIDAVTSVGEFWASLFQLARLDVEPRPGTVNVVGLAAQGSPFSLELERVVEALGLRLNGLFVPSFRSEPATRFFEAERTFVSTARVARLEFSLAMEHMPQMRYVDVAAPFGPAATTRLYRSLSPADESATRRIEEIWEPYRRQWEGWQSRAQAQEVAILVRPEDCSCLTDPAELYGLRLVDSLREMGFKVRLLATSGGRAGGSAEAAKELAAHFVEQGRADQGVTLEVVPDDSPTQATLEALQSTLVFSEFAPDARATRAGKMAFHARMFEMGFGGALRTIARLTRLAESRFHRCFGVAKDRPSL